MNFVRIPEIVHIFCGSSSLHTHLPFTGKVENYTLFPYHVLDQKKTRPGTPAGSPAWRRGGGRRRACPRAHSGARPRPGRPGGGKGHEGRTAGGGVGSSSASPHRARRENTRPGGTRGAAGVAAVASRGGFIGGGPLLPSPPLPSPPCPPRGRLLPPPTPSSPLRRGAGIREGFLRSTHFSTNSSVSRWGGGGGWHPPRRIHNGFDTGKRGPTKGGEGPGGRGTISMARWRLAALSASASGDRPLAPARGGRATGPRGLCLMAGSQ